MITSHQMSNPQVAERYKPLSAPQRITEHQWPESTKAVVTIWCITFNHKAFIKDAIEGFLKQETAFPVEILIHDDASTDGTDEIIRQYQARYPTLIKAILQPENQYSQGRRARDFLQPISQGDYIAICEGDDYWTDPKKLQIQVDFLEKNPEYVISGHDAFIIDEFGNETSASKLPKSRKRDFTAEELVLGKAWILTMSMVFRNVRPVWPPEVNKVLNADKFVTSILGEHGGSKFHDDIELSAYRSHKGGVWSQKSLVERRDEHILTYLWVSRYYRRIGNTRAADHFFESMRTEFVQEISNREIASLLLERFRSWLTSWNIRGRVRQYFRDRRKRRRDVHA